MFNGNDNYYALTDFVTTLRGHCEDEINGRRTSEMIIMNIFSRVYCMNVLNKILYADFEESDLDFRIGILDILKFMHVVHYSLCIDYTPCSIFL